MPEPDAFDPTHALDGWRPPARAPLDLESVLQAGRGVQAGPPLLRTELEAFDPTHMLDGWHPPAPAPLDLEIRSLLRGRSGPDEAKLARLKARGYEMLDVEDIELPEEPVPRPALEPRVEEVPRDEPPIQPPAAAADATEPPPETSWPLFTAEAQVLDAGDLAAIEAAAIASLDVPPLPVAAAAMDAPVPIAAVEAPDVPMDAAAPEPERTTAVEEGIEAPEKSEADSKVVSASMATELAPAIDAAPSEALPTPPSEPAAVQPPAPDPHRALDDPAQAGHGAEPVADGREQPAPADAFETDVEAQAARPADLETEPLQDVAFVDEPPLPVAPPAPQPQAIEPAPLPESMAAAVEEPSPVVVEPPAVDFLAFPPAAIPDVRTLLDDLQLPRVPPPPTGSDAPVLDFRLPPPSPEPDPQRLIDELVLPKVAPPPAVTAAPELDVQALAPHAEPDPRLVAGWRPGAWTALVRRIADANTEVLQTADGLHVENYASQWLCALWPPQGVQPALLGRWPEMAALVGGETSMTAAQTLLDALPAEATLWPTELEADWGLIAELVLHQDDGLRPAQTRALRELAEAERSASLARLNAGYQPLGRVARRRA